MWVLSLKQKFKENPDLTDQQKEEMISSEIKKIWDNAYNDYYEWNPQEQVQDPARAEYFAQEVALKEYNKAKDTIKKFGME